jgi:hypothetical protein
MNYFEVVKKENIGKSYEMVIDGISKGVWKLRSGFSAKEFDFYRDGKPLTSVYFSSQIIRMKFEEVIDWAEVPVNTMIWVRESEEYDWLPRHFAKYEDGKVLAWNGGKTSFTATCEGETTSWEYVKLYQE